MSTVSFTIANTGSSGSFTTVGSTTTYMASTEAATFSLTSSQNLSGLWDLTGTIVLTSVYDPGQIPWSERDYMGNGFSGTGWPELFAQSVATIRQNGVILDILTSPNKAVTSADPSGTVSQTFNISYTNLTPSGNIVIYIALQYQEATEAITTWTGGHVPLIPSEIDLPAYADPTIVDYYPHSVVSTATSTSVVLTTASAPALPSITSFTASSYSVSTGANFTVTAIFANGTGVVNPGSRAITSGTPITITAPGTAQTISYILTVTDGNIAHNVANTINITVIDSSSTSYSVVWDYIPPATPGASKAIYSADLFDTAHPNYPKTTLPTSMSYPVVDGSGHPNKIAYFSHVSGAAPTLSPPLIHTHPINTTAALNGPAITFTCWAYGPGTAGTSDYNTALADLTFNWYRNGTFLSTDGTAAVGPAVSGDMLGYYMKSNLSVSATTLGQSGDTYYCHVVNSNGSTDSGTATLTVSQLPYNLTIPSSLSVNENATLSLGPLTPSGPGPFTYQWMLRQTDSVTLAVSDYVIPGATTSSYSTEALIYNTDYFTRISGSPYNYYCEVSNSHGMATSNVCVVTVTPTAVANPVLVTSPSNITTTVGMTPVTFTATFSGAHISSYIWYYKGASDVSYAALSEVQTSSTTANYTIIPSTTVFSGSSWYVVCYNGHGHTQSATATLTVNTASFGYRPTSGTGVVDFPDAIDTGSSTVIDTTSSDYATSGTGLGDALIKNYSFSGFGTGTASGTINISATTATELGYIAGASTIQFSYSYNGGATQNFYSTVGGSDDVVVGEDLRTSGHLSSVDLSTLTVGIKLYGQRAHDVERVYETVYAQIWLYDVVFITS